MKTIPAAIQTAIDTGQYALTTCLKITAENGTVLAFTEWQSNLVVGGVTYTSVGGYTPQDITGSSDSNVDNLDVVSYFDAAGVELSDIRAGILDNAAFRLFSVDPSTVADSPSSGEIKQRSGWLGRFSAGDVSFTAELRGLFQKLQMANGQVIAKACRADLYSTECGVVQTPPDWVTATAMTVVTSGDASTGTTVKPTTPNGLYAVCTVAGTTGGVEPTWPGGVGSTVIDGTDSPQAEWTMIRHNEFSSTLTSATDNATIHDTTLSEPNGWWNFGTITITSGTNNGIAREINVYLATGDITTFMPFPYDVAGNETFDIVAGCGKDRTTDCKSKFDNIYNMRAEPFTPGLDAIVQTPVVR